MQLINQMEVLGYGEVVEAIVEQVLKQSPEINYFKTDAMVFILRANDEEIELEVQGQSWWIELKQFIQGFKEDSFAVQYTLYQEEEEAWSGEVFVSPERHLELKQEMQIEERNRRRYMEWVGTLSLLELLNRAQLDDELTLEEIAVYAKQSKEQPQPFSLERLSQFQKEFNFHSIGGHQLSEVFTFESEGLGHLYGFVQELGSVEIESRQGTKQCRIYQLYATNGETSICCLGKCPGYKGLFAQSREAGVLFTVISEEETALDRLQEILTDVELLEHHMYGHFDFGNESFQLKVVRKDDRISIQPFEEELEHSPEEIEGVLMVIAGLQDLIFGEIEDGDEAYQELEQIMEQMDLDFIFQYHGIQPICGCTMEEILQMVDRVSNDPEAIKAYLMEPLTNGEISTLSPVEDWVDHQYILTAKLQFEPLTLEHVKQLADSVVTFLTYFYKIDYTDLSWSDISISDVLK